MSSRPHIADRVAGVPGLRSLLTQEAFNADAARRSRWTTHIAGILVLIVLAGVLLAAGLFGYKLAQEAPLLWFGTPANGIVEEARLSSLPRSKSGYGRYRLDVRYRFVAADGQSYAGTAQRSDLTEPIRLEHGQRIAIRYSARDPSHSTIEQNLKSDVVAMLIFLPFLIIVPGSISLMHSWRYLRWLRAAG